MVHGARALNGLSGATPSRELTGVVSGTGTMTKFSPEHWDTGCPSGLGKAHGSDRVAALLMREHWRQPRSSPRHVRDGCRASRRVLGHVLQHLLRAVVERLGQCHRDGEPLVLCPSTESSQKWPRR